MLWEMNGKNNFGHQTNTDNRQHHKESYYAMFKVLKVFVIFVLFICNHNLNCLWHYGSYDYKSIIYS